MSKYNKNTDFSSTDNIDTNSSNGIEHQLREIWKQYVSCLEKSGLNESAKVFRDKYFALYRSYRRDKNWRNMIIDS